MFFKAGKLIFELVFSKVLRINNKTILLVAKTLNNKNAQLFYFKTEGDIAQFMNVTIANGYQNAKIAI